MATFGEGLEEGSRDMSVAELAVEEGEAVRPDLFRLRIMSASYKF